MYRQTDRERERENAVQTMEPSGSTSREVQQELGHEVNGCACHVWVVGTGR